MAGGSVATTSLTEKCADFHPSKNHTDKVSDDDPDDDIDTARRQRRGRNRDHRAFGRHGLGACEANFWRNSDISSSVSTTLQDGGLRFWELGTGHACWNALDWSVEVCCGRSLDRSGWLVRRSLFRPVNCRPLRLRLVSPSTTTNARCLPVSRRRASTGVTSRPVTVSSLRNVRDRRGSLTLKVVSASTARAPVVVVWPVVSTTTAPTLTSTTQASRIFGRSERFLEVWEVLLSRDGRGKWFGWRSVAPPCGATPVSPYDPSCLPEALERPEYSSSSCADYLQAILAKLVCVTSTSSATTTTAPRSTSTS